MGRRVPPGPRELAASPRAGALPTRSIEVALPSEQLAHTLHLAESMDFVQLWHTAAVTTLGLFWTAFWAFGLGYLISSMIQVFVTRARMRRTMGEAGARSVALGTFFGFISSSCSFAALATTRSLFTKGAGLVPSLAFMLASTNLVVELGLVIGMFLGWQFVVGEYLGGLLLIVFMWALVKLTARRALVEHAREHAREQEGSDSDGEEDAQNWKSKMASREGWSQVANRYVMEWRMVWKDVVIGFTVAGVIATFVPRSFFETLFVGSGADQPAFWQVLVQALVGPVAAFFTFIGSMGNIPLAAVLFGNGVSFAGVMAFIFSDLVVFPVLRIQAGYYGWRFALYVLSILLAALVGASVLMHYGFTLAGALPDASSARSVTEREFFKLDYTFALNLVFLAVSAVCVGWKAIERGFMQGSAALGERVLLTLALLSFLWLGAGAAVPLFAGDQVSVGAGADKREVATRIEHLEVEQASGGANRTTVQPREGPARHLPSSLKDRPLDAVPPRERAEPTARLLATPRCPETGCPTSPHLCQRNEPDHDTEASPPAETRT